MRPSLGSTSPFEQLSHAHTLWRVYQLLTYVGVCSVKKSIDERSLTQQCLHSFPMTLLIFFVWFPRTTRISDGLLLTIAEFHCQISLTVDDICKLVFGFKSVPRKQLKKCKMQNKQKQLQCNGLKLRLVPCYGRRRLRLSLKLWLWSQCEYFGCTCAPLIYSMCMTMNFARLIGKNKF